MKKSASELQIVYPDGRVDDKNTTFYICICGKFDSKTVVLSEGLCEAVIVNITYAS